MAKDKINYYEYIKSEAWQEVRRRYYKSKMFRCFSENDIWECYCCGANNVPLDLHHRTYKRLGNERINIDLVPVCRSCHTEIHILEKEYGLNLWGATKKVRQKYTKSKRKERKKDILKIRRAKRKAKRQKSKERRDAKKIKILENERGDI